MKRARRREAKAFQTLEKIPEDDRRRWKGLEGSSFDRIWEANGILRAREGGTGCRPDGSGEGLGQRLDRSQVKGKYNIADTWGTEMEDLRDELKEEAWPIS